MVSGILFNACYQEIVSSLNIYLLNVFLVQKERNRCCAQTDLIYVYMFIIDIRYMSVVYEIGVTGNSELKKLHTKQSMKFVEVCTFL